jgi:hypothetical protein
VALTRTKEHLFLTLATKYAEGEREPSEFLQNIGYDNWRAGGPKYKVKRLTLELLARPNLRTFELTKDEKACEGCGYRLYCGEVKII